MERIYVKKQEVEELVMLRRNMDHIERYLMVRRFVYGNVVDFGCGVGYGSKLLSENPDVVKVIGFDIQREVIEHAKQEFENDKVKFIHDELDFNIKVQEQPTDVLIAIEIIEHIEKADKFYDQVKFINPNIVILSFPNKPSRKYNPYHYHDYNEQDICNLMSDYIAIKRKDIKDVTLMMFIKAPVLMPRMNYHNILQIWV